MEIIKNFNYRPEVDGLRAVAVLAVVLYHADLGFVTGGFVGVDVFFVISGYLITSLIIKDVEREKFSIVAFWEKRARRILPASTVMVIVTLLIGWIFLLPSDLIGLRNSAIAHTLFFANFYFWRNTDYFAGPAEEKPLLHTWSLAVEEQFYFAIPFLILLVILLFRKHRLLCLYSLFIVGFIVSLFASVILVRSQPNSAFYLLTSRAWELLCGSLVSLLPVPRNVIFRSFAVYAGLLAIIVPCFLFTKETSFPGLNAIYPCIGASLIIWTSKDIPGFQTIKNKKPLLVNLLASRPFVFIGLISYSLYLWHWPVFAFTRYWSLSDLSLGLRICLVIFSFFLAVLSWRFIETPFRLKEIGTTRRRLFTLNGTGAFAALVLALLVTQSLSPLFRINHDLILFDKAFTEARSKNYTLPALSLNDANAGRFLQIGEPHPAPIHVLVWGDSHARAILPGVEKIAKEAKLGITAAWNSSTPPVINFNPETPGSLLGDTPAYAEAVIRFVQQNQVPHVLLAARWSGYPNAEIHDHLLKTVERLVEINCKPWVLVEVPNHHIPVPKIVSYKTIFKKEITLYLSDSSDYTKRNAPLFKNFEELIKRGAGIIDVAPLLHCVESDRFNVLFDGNVLYYDRHHLTKFGAIFVADAFRPIFSNSP
jgi:peptidoglycan/LPS O-acetylase OafA/YrhL